MAPHAHHTTLDLGDLFGILRRRLLSLVAMSALILAPCLLYLQLATPKYTATTLVQVDPGRDVLRETAEEARNNASMSALVDGEVEVIRSDRVLLALIREAGLVTDPEFGLRPSRTDRVRALLGLEMSPLPNGEVALNRVLNRVREAVRVRRNGGTYLIAISVTTQDPVRSARLANLIAELHTRNQVAEKSAQVRFVRDTIASRIEEGRVGMEMTEARLSDFFLTATELAIAETGRTDLQRMRDLITGADLEIRDREARVELLSGLVEGDRSVRAELGDAALEALIRERDAVAGELTAPEADPEAVRARIARLDAQIRDQAAASLGSVRAEISAVRQDRERAEGELRSALLSGEVPPRVLSELYGLQQEAEIAREQYMSLLSRLRQLESMADLQVPDVRVVSDASPNFTPSSPRSRLILLVGVAMSLLAGLLFALLREFQIGGFTSTDQVANAVRPDEVVAIPRAPGAPTELARLIGTDPLGAYAESVRRLRYAAQRLTGPASGDAPEGRVICVTSATQNEGKTTLAISLARAFADSGSRTVLVDLDLRNPSVAGLVGADGGDGLMRFLVGELDTPGLVSRLDGTALDLIPGGERARVPTDPLLTSPRFAELLAALRSNYDVIILDTPPVLPVIDPLLVARHADLLVMPIRYGRTGQSAVRQTVSRLGAELRDGARLIPVLNMDPDRSSTYYNGYTG